MSWTKIAGASRKLPKGLETKVAHIIARVANVQIAQQKHNIIVAPVKDDNMCNTDHVPLYIDMYGNYSWGENISGGRHIATGGKEKEHITVQLENCKSGRKLKPVIIFRGAPPPKNGRLRKNTIAYEIKRRLPDKKDNAYPPYDKVHLMVSKTAKSSSKLTIEVLENVNFP